MVKPIRLIILCSSGATSGLLAGKVEAAAKKKGIPLTAQAGDPYRFQHHFLHVDVVLLEPQVSHMEKELRQIADVHRIPLEPVDPRAFATMNGERVLEQVLRLLNRSPSR